MPHSNESSPRRRLRTPCHREADRNADSSRRSRSRTRRQGDSYRSRSRVRTSSQRQGRDNVSQLEHQLENHRERLRVLENELSRERSLRPRATPQAGRHNLRVSKDNEQDRLRVRDRSLPRERSPTVRRSHEVRDAVDNASPPPRNVRSDSPAFTSKDIMNIINTLGNIKSRSQPSTVSTPVQNSNNNINHMNILPNFDPSSNGQRIDIWLKKVNECATVYGWDERTIIHFAMQKLQGLAKTWYESLNSILFSWSEWQHKLMSAFPFEQSYGQSLEDMLKRISKSNEPIEVYYYEKLALLNRCDIEGKRAVECIIHGLSDRTMRSSANAVRCTQPDQLLQFLVTNKDVSQFSDRANFKGKSSSTSDSSNNNASNRTSNRELFCYNCKEKGHPYLKCPKPLIQCEKCRKFGHKGENCPVKFGNDKSPDKVQKTMRILTSESVSGSS